jgi:tetratricopeptide (TPR) repeat protein
MAGGKLYESAPACPEFFQKPHVVCNDKYYSKYTIGMPLLLIPGVIAGMTFIISPLLAGGTLVFLYLCTKRLFNSEAGVIAVLIALFSPYFFMLGATVFPHTACGFFAILAMFCFVRFRDTHKIADVFIAGLALGMAALIRPGDGLFLIAGFLPLFISGLKKSGGIKNAVFGLIIFGIGVSILLAILGYANLVQNGNPLVMGFAKYDPDESFGFGGNGHTPVHGVWNIFISLVLLSFWVVPFITPGLLVAFRRMGLRTLAYILPSAAILILYFFFYSIGNVGFGPRYLYPGWVLLIPLAAGGLSYLPDYLPGRLKLSSGAFVTALLIIFVAFTAFAPLSVISPKFRTEFGNLRADADKFKALQVQGKSLLITGNFPSRLVYLDVFNSPKPDKEERMTTYYLLPEENLKLIKAYPDRKPYVVFLDPASNNYVIQPYPVGAEGGYSPDEYNLAAINYHKFTLFLSRAADAFDKAYQSSGGNLSLLFNKVIICYQMKDYKTVEATSRKILEIDPSFTPAYYYLGISTGEQGNLKEAVDNLNVFISQNPPSGIAEKAKVWIDYYRSKL